MFESIKRICYVYVFIVQPLPHIYEQINDQMTAAQGFVCDLSMKAQIAVHARTNTRLFVSLVPRC